MKFLILHGTGANHTSNWFSWLRNELEQLGHEVWVPDLPDSDKPDPTTWSNYLINSGYDFSDIYIIGHSSGAVEIMDLLQTMNKDTKISVAFLVGVFRGYLQWESLRAMDISFDYQTIKQKARKFIVLHSDNDPHCPLDGAKWIARQLDAEFVLMPGMNHFSKEIEPRFDKFPELLAMINEQLQLLEQD